MGDLLDFYALSRFDRNPERIFGLQSDIDQASDILADIKKSSNGARVIYLRGNHEHRLTRYLWTKAAEIAGLRNMRLESLLELKRLGVSYIEQGRTNFHGFIVKHGTIVRNKAGYTATAELEREGVSGISAHTHRLSQIFKRNTGGDFTWLESGCLSQLDPEYADGETMDWCHGMVYGYFKKGDRRFIVHPLPIVRGKVVHNGQELAGRVAVNRRAG